MNAHTGSIKAPQARRGLPAGQRLLIAATAATVLVAFVPGAQLLLYPLRLFVTLVHEGGHAVMTLLTGGAVRAIAIDPSGSGVTYSVGGIPFVVLMAGYLGTLAVGALSLQIGRRPGAGRGALLLMGVVAGLVTVLWVRNPFGFAVGLGAAGALLAAARLLRGPAADFACSFLAVQLCLNAVLDLRGLLWLTTQTHAANDAVFMSQLYGMPPWFWAGMWAATGVLVLAAALRSYWRGCR